MKINFSLRERPIEIETSFVIELDGGDSYRITEEEGQLKVSFIQDSRGRLGTMTISPRSGNSILVGYEKDQP